MQTLLDLMVSDRRYLLCTCVTEHKLAISGVMRVESGFWNDFELPSYPDSHD
jgi:hypothetical protein